MFGFYLVKFSLEGCYAFELRIERLLHRIDHFFETFDALGVSGRRAVAADQGGRTSEGTLFGGVPAETERTLDRACEKNTGLWRPWLFNVAASPQARSPIAETCAIENTLCR